MKLSAAICGALAATSMLVTANFAYAQDKPFAGVTVNILTRPGR